MKEDVLQENRPKLSRFSDRKSNAKANIKTSGNTMKSKATWGANIVKGFSTEKKAKSQPSLLNKKLPSNGSDISYQKNQGVSYPTRVKRSIIGDFPFSANSAQVHPHSLECHCSKHSASHDVFLELDHLRSLLQESKERELKLQNEIVKCKGNVKISELEHEIDTKNSEIDNLLRKCNMFETENSTLSEQLNKLSSSIHSREGSNGKSPERQTSRQKNQNNWEMEVVELRRLNKELQIQKRNLTCSLSSAESQLAALSKSAESDMVAKVKAEASVLRHTNEDLCKQVEGLQMSRLTEVEELVYLRWVNSCLRHELQNSDNSSREMSGIDNNEDSPGHSEEIPSQLSEGYSSSERNNDRKVDARSSACFSEICESFDFDKSKKPSMIKKVIQRNNNDAERTTIHGSQDTSDKWIEPQESRSPNRRHSISGLMSCRDRSLLRTRRQSDGYFGSKQMGVADSDGRCSEGQQYNVQNYDIGYVQSPRFFACKNEITRLPILDIEKRALRIPNPPPKPSVSISNLPKKDGITSVPPPPPPPPPPPSFAARNTNVMKRAPQVVEFYHSLMKRDTRKENCGGGICDTPNVANARDSMIGEIENRSSHLLAIKADVETQGEFVNSLIKEVNGAVYRDIEDVVAFVKWLDDELGFLVDERAVLKHFDWPEKKADALREAAFGYRDLKKLESEVIHYVDDPRLPCDVALKKMAVLSEKMERTVFEILRTRDVMIRRCKEFQIPTDWVLDTGIISKIKFASVKLAKKYVKRVAMAIGAADNDPSTEYMLLKGVRFAFRIHQFAGGFDAETMHAFEEMKNLAHIYDKK